MEQVILRILCFFSRIFSVAFILIYPMYTLDNILIAKYSQSNLGPDKQLQRLIFIEQSTHYHAYQKITRCQQR